MWRGAVRAQLAKRDTGEPGRVGCGKQARVRPQQQRLRSVTQGRVLEEGWGQAGNLEREKKPADSVPGLSPAETCQPGDMFHLADEKVAESTHLPQGGA